MVAHEHAKTKEALGQLLIKNPLSFTLSNTLLVWVFPWALEIPGRDFNSDENRLNDDVERGRGHGNISA